MRRTGESLRNEEIKTNERKTQMKVKKVKTMGFGDAIKACQFKGKKIQRVNWNGEEQFVRYESVLAFTDGHIPYDKKTGKKTGAIECACFVFHYKNRKTGETGLQVGWLASQADMMAQDWVIVG